MKKLKNQSMPDSDLVVIARFDHCLFLPDMIEELANKRISKEFTEVTMPHGSLAIETSIMEACVSGNLVYSNNDLHQHFTTGFLFTCVKPVQGETYKLAWCSSLS